MDNWNVQMPYVRAALLKTTIEKKMLCNYEGDDTTAMGMKDTLLYGLENVQGDEHCYVNCTSFIAE
jgi:hypothetical protein